MDRQAHIRLPQILDELESMHGRPQPLEVTDPFEIILLENVVYLSSDDTRRKAFMELLRMRFRIS